MSHQQGVCGLYAPSADGSFQLVAGEQIVAAALNYLDTRIVRGQVFDRPQEVKNYLSLKLGALPYEVFAVVYLDSQHRLIEYREMFRGTLTQTSVYPREIVKVALELNAAAVLLAHNHPSQMVEPSRADELLTQTLQKTLSLVDVRVLDHIVVGGGSTCSFAERGLL